MSCLDFVIVLLLLIEFVAVLKASFGIGYRRYFLTFISFGKIVHLEVIECI